MSDFKDTGGSAFPLAIENHVLDDGMTLRQYAAIKLKVPDSGTGWLDDMIRQSLRDDLAAKAMQALITRIEMSGGEKAGEAYRIADAMLKAGQA